VSDASAIERAFFREAEDGSTVYFPWGLTRGGYRLPDEATRKKAARASSTLMGGTVAVGTWTASILQPLLQSETAGPAEVARALAAPGAALALVIVGYWLWVARFVEPFAPSDLAVSREDRLREAARIASPRRVAGIGFLACGMGALVAWIEPHGWWLGLLGIAVGVGFVYWSHLLARAASTRPD
jgi:hypothetical protein